MHSPGYRWTTLIAATAVLLSFGCRGSKPFGRFVKVTQEPSTDLANLEPPQQRLATSGSRMQTEVTMTAKGPAEQLQKTATGRPTSSKSKLESASNAIQKASATAALASAKKTPKRKLKRSSVAKVSARKLRSPKGQANDRQANDRQANGGQASDRRVSDTVATLASDAMPATDDDTLLQAFADYPPEVQKEAMRRLVAATSKAAEKTSQPAGFEQELKQQARSLPPLPPATKTKAEVPAIRLASGQPSASTPSPTTPATPRATASITDLVTTPIAPSEATSGGATSSETAISAVPPSPATKSITNMPAINAGKVQPASATGSSTSSPTGMVTRAALDTASVTKPAVDVAALDLTALDDKALYQELLKKLSKASEGESDSERASRMIKLRHLMVLSGDVDSAVEKIEGMSGAEQEFLRHQLLGLWTMVDPGGHPVTSRRITTALPQLREATKFAAAATDSLEVRSLAFCTEIESYGQIKPFPGNRFDAGQQVILYCEIENFTAKSVENGFETQMQGSYDIYDANQQKVVSQLLPADRQISTNHLRDYYIAYQMHLPKQLPAGTYRLQLTMEDIGGKKYGQASIPLEIAK